MPSILRALLAFTFLFALAAGPAHATPLSLNYAGVTVTGSSLPSGAIAPGTAFELHALFDSTPTATPATGLGFYMVTAINFTIGGTSYSVSSGIGSAYYIVLGDPSLVSSSGNYISALGNTGYESAFAPVYSTATPTLDAWSATPTVFSGYLESIANSMLLYTSGGDINLVYDQASIASSIIPEPSSLALLLAGTFGVALARRRSAA
ncbi:MAG: PEP-CTERM sorting domain-containing protein [Candidatus Methylumidiphilus sp.]